MLTLFSRELAWRKQDHLVEHRVGTNWSPLMSTSWASADLMLDLNSGQPDDQYDSHHSHLIMAISVLCPICVNSTPTTEISKLFPPLVSLKDDQTGSSYDWNWTVSFPNGLRKNVLCFRANSRGHRQIGCAPSLWYYWTPLLIEFAAAGRRSNCFWLFHSCKWARAFWEFSSNWADLTLSPACEELRSSISDWGGVSCNPAAYQWADF